MKELEVKINVSLIILGILAMICIACISSVVKTSINANKEIKLKQFEVQMQMQMQLYGEPVSSNIEE